MAQIGPTVAPMAVISLAGLLARCWSRAWVESDWLNCSKRDQLPVASRCHCCLRARLVMGPAGLGDNATLTPALSRKGRGRNYLRSARGRRIGEGAAVEIFEAVGAVVAVEFVEAGGGDDVAAESAIAGSIVTVLDLIDCALGRAVFAPEVVHDSAELVETGIAFARLGGRRIRRPRMRARTMRMNRRTGSRSSPSGRPAAGNRRGRSCPGPDRCRPRASWNPHRQWRSRG